MNNNQEFHTVRGYEIIGKQKQALSHSMEDYLEMIYRNCLNEGHIRINVLAESLNVQAPSATKMVQKLGKLGLLHYEKYGTVKMTPEGEKVGRYLLKRHETIENFLKIIGVEQNLLVNVELIEHSVTPGALHKIEILNQFFRTYPEILEKYEEYRISKENEDKIR